MLDDCPRLGGGGKSGHPPILLAEGNCKIESFAEALCGGGLTRLHLPKADYGEVLNFASSLHAGEIGRSR